MYEFKVSGMTCPSCQRTIRYALQQLDPNAEIQADVRAQKVQVKSNRTLKEVADLIEDIGFPVLESKEINMKEAL